MTAKYYIANVFWGAFIVAGVFYSFWGVDKNYKEIILVFSFVSAFFYPFAKYLIEKLIVKRTGMEFWKKGFFRDGVPKTKMVLFYYVFCLLLAIPLGMACIILEYKNTASRR